MSRKSGSAIGRYEIGTQARPQTELVRSTLRLFVCLFLSVEDGGGEAIVRQRYLQLSVCQMIVDTAV